VRAAGERHDVRPLEPKNLIFEASLEIWLEFSQNGIRDHSGADGCDGAEEPVSADPDRGHEGA
jgi:hypothetical protein